jgi:ferric-dicitrate binding protein FerR (iron transport regulator)
MDHWKKYIENPKFLRWVFESDAALERDFSDFFKAHPEEEKEYRQVRKELRLLSITDHEISWQRGRELFQSISGQIRSSEERRKIVPFRLGTFMRYAAVAVIFFAIGALFIYFPARDKTNLKVTEELFLKEARIFPTLYFADGSKIEIASGNRFIDLSIGNKLVVGDDTISYPADSHDSGLSDVLVIPNGQHLQVRMADRTSVWLNAGSRLIFPRQFSTDKREVYLAGEAYFDVSANAKHPFFVNTSYLSVKVLGTRFNVSAYPDDAEITAALEEGKIQILDNQSAIPGVTAELAPNQLACLTKSNNELVITNQNYELHTGWKEGILQFEDEQMNQLVKRIERYFDMKIILKDTYRGKERVRGKLDLNAGPQAVLEYLTKMTKTNVNQVNTNTYILE